MTYKEGLNLTYGKEGRLPHAVTQAGSTRIDYDANGNMLKKGNQELAYDIENRLLKVEDKTQEGPGGKSISFSLYLAPGWNNFSLPIILSDTKVSSSLASISGKFDQISRYNPSTKAFEHYVANPKYDQFSELEYGRGYQIYVTSPQGCLLSLSGILPKTSSVSLKAEIGRAHV